MRNPEVALTRSMILEHVWDQSVDPFTNTVDVHIQLPKRKKIDAPFKSDLFHTVHGLGYKMQELGTKTFGDKRKKNQGQEPQ